MVNGFLPEIKTISYALQSPSIDDNQSQKNTPHSNGFIELIIIIPI